MDTLALISDAPPDVTVCLSQVLELPEAMKVKALEGKKVVLLAATLRPETMYGQTNCWVLPHEKDGSEVRLHSSTVERTQLMTRPTRPESDSLGQILALPLRVNVPKLS